MSGSQSFCGSFLIPVTTLCIVMFAERQAPILPAKPNLLPGRTSKETFFTHQQKHVTCQINKDTNLYYTTPICIYLRII
jgi:hypothetical protein